MFSKRYTELLKEYRDLAKKVALDKDLPGPEKAALFGYISADAIVLGSEDPRTYPDYFGVSLAEIRNAKNDLR